MKTITCQAAIADGQGKFSIEQIRVAGPETDEILVRIQAAGICHTDYASLNWKRPLVMGHEGAGIVEEIGPQVTHVKPGERVVLNWAIPCGTCFQCRGGHPVLCEESKPAYVMQRSKGHARLEGTTWRGQPIDRSFNLGTLSEFALVRAAAVSPIPATVSFTAACIVGCGVMTGFGSVMNVARIKSGSSVAVLGCGGVGLNIIQAARLGGAKVIIAIDLHSPSLERAKKFGATDLVQVKTGDGAVQELVQNLKDLTGGRGADYAFEATSVPRLAFVPLMLVRNGGMALQVSGINEEVTVPMPQFMWNKTYVTPLYGDCVPARDFPLIFDSYLERKLLLDEIITKTYGLQDLGDAFEDMLSGKNAKGVILFQEGG
ncbi:MAG TPA: alcohol dehydrogenase catalytic domain-containing protein [Verrucomicrobiae bacterium]